MRPESAVNSSGRSPEIEREFLWMTSAASATIGHQRSECSAEMRTILREFLANECLLTAKNADTLCCYWSLTEDHLDEMTVHKPAGEECHEVIRLTWPAQSLFDLNYRILPVSLQSCHEHLWAPYSGQIYQVEIGWLCKNGRFISLLTSNRSDTH